MTPLPAEGTAAGPTDGRHVDIGTRDPHPWDTPAGASAAAGVAWIAVLSLSAVPAISSQGLFGAIPPWLLPAQIGIVLALLTAALIVRGLRRLWRYSLIAGALILLPAAGRLFSFDLPALQSMLGSTPFDTRMQAEQTGRFAVTLGMIVVLLAIGLRPTDFFLTPGRLTAPIRPVPMLGFPKPDSWRRFGLIWGFGVATALAVAQFLVMRPELSSLPSLLPMAPSILIYAALNAFNEEMTYRAPMLATLEPAVGGRHALWLAAVYFGVAHYFGIPGGLLGATLSIFMGWLLSKAMLETRGLFWAWWIHFLSDVVIFSFIALTLIG